MLKKQKTPSFLPFEERTGSLPSSQLLWGERPSSIGLFHVM